MGWKLELAQNDYVWVAESDDWCEPSLYKHWLMVLVKVERKCYLPMFNHIIWLAITKNGIYDKGNCWKMLWDGRQYVKQSGIFCTIISKV
jgi:hypothetical protein